MIILGINFGHDSSVSILRDGKIIAAIEEEKVSRIKQDFGWPRKAIQRLLKEHDIKKNEISIISVDSGLFDEISPYEIDYRFTKKKIYKIKEIIRRLANYYSFTSSSFNNVKSKQSFERNIYNEGFINSKIDFHDHHLAHAASAYYTAPMKCDIIITSDGMGGDSSFNFYEPTKNGLNIIKKNKYDISVGAFYSMITKLLGFRPTRHEGKITGLAAFGKETDLVGLFKSLWKYENKKLSRYPFNNIDKEWKKYNIDNQLSLKEKINLKTSSGKISSDYAKRSIALFFWLKHVTNGYTKEDIAYACQKTAEDITLNEIKLVLDSLDYKSVSIGLAGGVFANVRINQLIYELEHVNNIFVHPAMGDSGLSLGSAILSELKISATDFLTNKYSFNNTFLGPNYSHELKSFVQNFDYPNIEMIKMKSPEKDIAKLLFENKIVGLWNGRLEWGPRALGNRSIILNTFDRGVNDSLNARLNRTEFMPFAPVVLDKIAKTYFPKYDKNIPAADYMTMTYDTAPEFHELLQATVHVDGTARPQIAYEKTSPLYYGILKEFYKLSGCAALVNTSFNAHEEPILSDPLTGINSLINGRVDFLVMENYLFKLKLND
jgi:carbamoyltransferase